MESRTSPGKRGSVQPISESLTRASPAFRAWVSRRVGSLGPCTVSSSEDECVGPGQGALWGEQI